MRSGLLLALACVASWAVPASAQSVKAMRIHSGVGTPTCIASAPGDPARLYVTGTILGVWVIENGLPRSTPFLNLSGTLAPGEGLTGLAFHPDYVSNGRFYLVYQDVNQLSWVVEYRVSADPNLADPNSARVLLGPVPQPDIIHNWNCVQFGPDGMLYVATGDGGFFNDPSGNAQNLGSLLGKLLRIDTDPLAPRVPPDNPFVGVPGARGEIWAYGLREPWRFSFDRETGDLWLADVGEGSREEIDFQPAASTGGENYGWRCMEGADCTSISGCGCNDPTWTDPIFDYAHGPSGCAVIGGYVYRGDAIPGLQGSYFYGDFCSGRVWSLRYDGAQITEHVERTAELAPCAPWNTGGITSFGEDAEGELYFTTLGNGQLFKLVPADATSRTYCVGAPNTAGPGARIVQAGSTRIAQNDFRLIARGAVPGQFGLFFYGTQRGQSPFGHGFRCVTGQTFRLHPALTIAPDGTAVRAVDFGAPAPPGGEILAGSVWNFQFWYRDPAAGPPGFNLSDGLHVEFCP